MIPTCLHDEELYIYIYWYSAYRFCTICSTNSTRSLVHHSDTISIQSSATDLPCFVYVRGLGVCSSEFLRCNTSGLFTSFSYRFWAQLNQRSRTSNWSSWQKNDVQPVCGRNRIKHFNNRSSVPMSYWTFYYIYGICSLTPWGDSSRLRWPWIHARGNRGWRAGWSREEEKRNNMGKTANKRTPTCFFNDIYNVFRESPRF